MHEPLDKSIRQWGMWCHLSGLAAIALSVLVPIPFLGVLAPFIVWQIGRDRHSFIDEQGREAINFQISMAIYLVTAFLIWLFLMFATCAVGLSAPNSLSNLMGWAFILGIAFLLVFGIFQLCVVIFAATKASQGQSYRYPYTLRFLQ